MATDPYAALARLPANVVRGATGPGPSMSSPNAMAAGANAAPTARARFVDEDALRAAPGLAGFQSKFNRADLQDDGSMIVTLQKPGGDKYDLVNVRYMPDPQTGEFVMQGAPQEFRQESSLSSGLRNFAAPAAFLGGGAMLANSLMGGAAAASGGSAAGGGAATGAATGAASGAATGAGAAGAAGATAGGIGTLGATGSMAAAVPTLAPIATGGMAAAVPAGLAGLSLPSLAPVLLPAGMTGGLAGSAANAVNSAAAALPSGAGGTLSSIGNAITSVPGKTWTNLIGAGVTAAGLAGATGGGSGSSPASLAGVANSASQTSDDALAWFRSTFDAQAPAREQAANRAGQVSDAQLSSMTMANDQARELADFQRQTFRPVQQRIATDALAYDSPERRMQAAAAAAADVDVSAAAAQRATDRALGRAGVAPGSSKALAAREDASVGQAIGRGASMTNAVRNVERTGNERMLQAANLGQSIAGQQANQQQIGIGAGNSAVASANSGLQATQSGNQLMQQGFNTRLNGLATAGNLFNGVAAGERQDNRDLLEGIGQIGQFVGNIFSDKGMKKGTGKMADSAKALKEVEGTPVHEDWQYDPKKGGPDDGGKKHTGPMAQDVKRTMGEAAAPGGKMIDPVTMNGRMLAAVQELSKRVKKLEAA